MIRMRACNCAGRRMVDQSFDAAYGAYRLKLFEIYTTTQEFFGSFEATSVA